MPKNKIEIHQPGTLTWPFKIGDQVKDKITGKIGVVTSRHYHVTGCDRFMVEVFGKKEDATETIVEDGNRFELYLAHPERHIDEVPDIHVKLGDLVKDRFTGITGRAMIIMVPLYGAVRVTIEPPFDKKTNTLPQGYFVDIISIEVVEPYDDRPKTEQKPNSETKKSRGHTRMGGERDMRMLR